MLFCLLNPTRWNKIVAVVVVVVVTSVSRSLVSQERLIVGWPCLLIEVNP